MQARGNVVLLGFVAAGKTTCGALLADRLGWPHCDVDALLEARVGAIPDYVAARGVPAFRAIERDILVTLPGSGAVISTGAGTLLHREARAALLRPGCRAFYLDAPAAVLAARLWALAPAARHRPDLVGADLRETEGRIARVLAARRPLYERVGIRVDASRPPEQVVEAIWVHLHRG